MLEEKDYFKKQINLLAKVLKALLALALKKGDNIEERLKESVYDEILGHKIDSWLKMNEVEYESALKNLTDDAEIVKQFLLIQLEMSNRYFIEDKIDKSIFYLTKAEITKSYYDSISATYNLSLETKYSQIKKVINEK